MAARSSKTTGRSRRGSTARSSSRKGAARKQPTAFEVSLRPEHRRELFALALITLALVTLIFFLTGTTGGVGSIYILGMQRLFGSGAFVVPLVLGLLGGAILIQERFKDSPLGGANVVGTVIVLLSLLTMLEFPAHDTDLITRVDEGGGWIGYTIVFLLDGSIGRPAALLVVMMLMLAGIMLTFNITLRELVPGMARWVGSLWHMAWDGARGTTRRSKDAPSLRPEPVPQPEGEPLVPEPSTSDVVLTPIAERPTRASLYRRADDDTATPAPKADTPQPSTQSTQSQTPPAAAPEPVPGGSAPVKQDDQQGKVQEHFEEFDVPAIHLAWPLPAIDLLDPPTVTENTEEQHQVHTRLARVIEETLASFKVEAQVVNRHIGPTVTQFELQPAVGVKISKITTLEKDLALALAAPSIRIEAPIPGKSVVGIEIPNPAISLVSLHEVIASSQFEGHTGKLKLPLGKDVSGNPMVADMARMPHLLVAGSTGSGKSVAINSFLCGLLLKHTPEDLRMILIDPKMVELIVYNRVPHLLSPVVTELERVVPTLRWATREMERRYKVFARHGCRNLEGYLQRVRQRPGLEPMPYILIVIDELADLMMMAPDDVETQICRLAQMARATGIHLIIATQRPSVDVITGLIKANFPSRIAFAVTSQVDSRVILDTPGAERLLGRGDMLYMAADSAKLLRMQGTFVSDREVERIVEFWRSATPPEHAAKHQGQPSSESNTAGQQSQSDEQKKEQAGPTTPSRGSQEGDDHDDILGTPGEFLSAAEQETLYPQAVDLVRQHKRASASLLQRRLRIGYSKAAQLIELLEEQGVVGSATEGRSREVLAPDGAEE